MKGEQKQNWSVWCTVHDKYVYWHLWGLVHYNSVGGLTLCVCVCAGRWYNLLDIDVNTFVNGTRRVLEVIVCNMGWSEIRLKLLGGLSMRFWSLIKYSTTLKTVVLIGDGLASNCIKYQWSTAFCMVVISKDNIVHFSLYSKNYKKKIT